MLVPSSIILMVYFCFYNYLVTSSMSESSPVPCDWYLSNFFGLLHINLHDSGAGFATAFFLYVMNSIIYANRYNLLPWVHITTSTRLAEESSDDYVVLTAPSKYLVNRLTQPELTQRGNISHPLIFNFSTDGLWNRYFSPILDYKPSMNCNIPFVELSGEAIDLMHYHETWSIRSWKYAYSSSQPWKKSDDAYDEEWTFENRFKANTIFTKYFRPLPKFQMPSIRLISEMKAKLQTSNFLTLGIHIRGSDKGAGRRLVPFEEFHEYAVKFLEALPLGRGAIFLATDDERYLSEVMSSNISSFVFRMNSTTLSSSSEPNFQIFMSKRDLVNSDVFSEIIMLSKCDYLIHAHSAVSEAAIFMNLKLHSNSVNLEYRNYSSRQFSPNKFAERVRDHWIRVQGLGNRPIHNHKNESGPHHRHQASNSGFFKI